MVCECSWWRLARLLCCLQGPGLWQLHHTEPGHTHCRQPHLHHHIERLVFHSGKLTMLKINKLSGTYMTRTFE